MGITRPQYHQKFYAKVNAIKLEGIYFLCECNVRSFLLAMERFSIKLNRSEGRKEMNGSRMCWYK